MMPADCELKDLGEYGSRCVKFHSPYKGAKIYREYVIIPVDNVVMKKPKMSYFGVIEVSLAAFHVEWAKNLEGIKEKISDYLLEEGDWE